MITKADLLEDFEYNPITGLFVRKTSKGKWKGVAWVESRNRFTGTIMSKGKTMSKDFKSLTEAVEWVDSKRIAIHKEFANNG